LSTGLVLFCVDSIFLFNGISVQYTLMILTTVYTRNFLEVISVLVTIIVYPRLIDWFALQIVSVVQGTAFLSMRLVWNMHF